MSLVHMYMELIDSCLTGFLENSPNPIPYHVQVNISHDIALALSYLHSNDIIHRDLSSNNVFLTSKLRAKLSDFRMTRLCRSSASVSLLLCERLELLKGTSDYSDRTHTHHTDQSAEFKQCWVDKILFSCMQRSRTLLNQLREYYRTVSHIQQDNDELREQLSQSGTSGNNPTSAEKCSTRRRSSKFAQTGKSK